MLHIGVVTLEQQRAPVAWPRLVLCARNRALADAWRGVDGDDIQVHRGSVLDVHADAVVSPANSFGSMRGGIDEVYARKFPGVEERVRAEILALHGGEMPVGQALMVPTGMAPSGPGPAWLICAPTMREPTERLPKATVNPYLAARAVFLLWRDGVLEDGWPVRQLVHTVAMPGMGTGVGGLDEKICARQVNAAWHEVFR